MKLSEIITRLKTLSSDKCTKNFHNYKYFKYIYIQKCNKNLT